MPSAQCSVRAMAFWRRPRSRRMTRHLPAGWRPADVCLPAMTALVVRPARVEEIPAVAVLAGKLVRYHHEVDGSRFFLPDRVEEGYEWWLGKELARKEARVLVAADGARVVGYSYGAREERD